MLNYLPLLRTLNEKLTQVMVNASERVFWVHQGRLCPIALEKKLQSIPILKPQKDPTSPKSYRPIALTSCLCKLMERLIKKKVLPEIEKVVQARTTRLLCPNAVQ
ncbi:hypothetical protein QYM36_019600 [Artemia franciscana]|uniref:Uncharacterized protein n=1 Tax=Artemia franciscana TaxID=6661 RepID=A0AA88KTP7_ARTSF|nr:hypothetical protein QYM36_019600 [Artemia franciscana]